MPTSLDTTLANARRALLAERSGVGPWRGCLSSSALSTATAVAALAASMEAWPGRVDSLRSLGQRGQRWLAANVNGDGGFGDTSKSPSNLSTTALGWMALGLDLGLGDEVEAARAGCRAWLVTRIGSLDGANFAQALGEVYGEDRTFAVPILMALAATDSYEGEAPAWDAVPSLPFELAALPQSVFRYVGLPVVSYALPALIAIGQAIEYQRPSERRLQRLVRSATRATTLARLIPLQPTNGGFLEATPLTSFIVLALCSCDEGAHEVVEKGIQFLAESVRADGSWPIDTDLATWGSTLAIQALGAGEIDAEHRSQLLDWLLGQQHAWRHPYTGAAPGGWAWTERPGGVPDADDTSGALLALRCLDPSAAASRGAARAGLLWLRDLQNRDGGIPTFCRGWGKLPFDQSCADLTAHALRAVDAWDGLCDLNLDAMRARALQFLIRTQAKDGSWLPLWFGNQEHPERQNPVYGTSRVLRAARVQARSGRDQALWNLALRRGLGWLLGAQAADGGFGGGLGLQPSIEETGLALEGLMDAYEAGLGGEPLRRAALRAVDWLVEATAQGTRFPATPIGLYFAQLWYHEELYPQLFCLSGLSRASELLQA